MKKVVLAHPTYGPFDPYVNKALRVAVMSAASDVKWVGDVSSIRQGWVAGRNQSVKDTLADAPEADGIVWVDDDVLLPPTAIKRLLSYDLDFVTGIIYQKFGDFYPLVADWTGKGYSFWMTYPENVLAPADGCGFGMAYTSTRMLRAIAELPSRATKGGAYFRKDGWFDQFDGDWWGANAETPMAEDFSFCRRAAAAGFQLYADTGLECPHLIGPKYSTRENHAKHWAKRKQERDEALERADLNAKSAVDRSREFKRITCADAAIY